MDTSNNARNEAARGQRLCNLDLFGHFSSEDDIVFTDLEARTYTRLAQAFAVNDLSTARALLSRWGVRR